MGVSPKPDPVLNCSINAIQGKGCFKCGSEDHFIKDCPLSQQNNMVPKGNYTDHRCDTKHDRMTDKVMEPLTKLFTDLVTQLKLLTPSGQTSHSGPPNSIGNDRNGQGQMGFHHGHIWHANGNYCKQVKPNKDCCTIKMPHTRVNEIESSRKCNSDCSVMYDPEEHLGEEVEPAPGSSRN